VPGAFRDDLEAARSRADALREENEELREQVARLRAQAPAEAQPALIRAPDSETRRTLERLAEMIEEADDPPAPEAPEEPAAPPPPRPRQAARRVAAPPAPSSTGESASLSTSLLETRLETLQRQIAEATKERDELRAGQQRRIRSFWLGVALGLALGVLLANVLR
jgi:hypothetical protein